MTNRYFSITTTKLLKPFIFIALLLCDLFTALLKPFTSLKYSYLFITFTATAALSAILSSLEVLTTTTVVTLVIAAASTFFAKIIAVRLSRLIKKTTSKLSKMYFSPIGIYRGF